MNAMLNSVQLRLCLCERRALLEPADDVETVVSALLFEIRIHDSSDGKPELSRRVREMKAGWHHPDHGIHFTVNPDGRSYNRWVGGKSLDP